MKKKGAVEKLRSYAKKLPERRPTKPISFEQKIYYSGRQYSCKLPTKLINLLNHKEGDKLRFTVKNPHTKHPEVLIEYVRST